MADVIVRGRSAADQRAEVRLSGAARILAPAIPFALFVVALGVRVYQLTAEPLWLDEGYTLLFSRMPLGKLLTVGGEHEHPPLYYLLVHYGIALSGSLMTPRVLSALFGSLAVVALFYLGKRLFGVVAGAVAALLLALSPLQLFYSQDGRGYELAGLLVVLSYLALIDATETGRRRSWAAYAIALALCLYCEYITALVLVPQILLLWRARRAGQSSAVWLALLAAVILFLPWIGVLVRDAYGIAGDYWIPAPNAPVVAVTFLEFVGLITACSNSPCVGHELGIPWLAGNEVAIASVLVAAVLLVGVLALRRRDTIVTVLVLWLVLPFVIVLLLAFKQPLYLDRVFLDATFPLFLLIGAGVGRARVTRLLAGVLALGMIGIAVPQMTVIYAGGYNPDWRTLGRDLAAAYRPGQGIFINPGVLRSLLAAYLPASWHPTREVPLWSRTYVDVPGWQHRFPAVVHPSRAQRNALDNRLRNYQLQKATDGLQQLWLVTYDYSGMNDTRRWLTDHGFQTVVSELYGGDTRLELWDRRPASALGPAVVPDNGLQQGWLRTGHITQHGGVVTTFRATSMSRTFAIRPGRAYSVAADYRGNPPASKPGVSLQVLSGDGAVLATFPRTMWYDWPVEGVWLSQPFGFVAPPGALRAVLTISSAWGESSWRHVAVYTEP